MKDLHLPLAEDSESVDYTTINNIKFSKKISGKERAKHIGEVFAEYYVKKLTIGHTCETYSEFSVKIENYTVGFRGYKNIVVCIIGDWGTPNFGPKGRAHFGSKGRLFEEEKNLFPFRKVLETVRDLTKADQDRMKTIELQQQEREFAIMELEGLAIMEFGVISSSITKVDPRYNPNPAIDFQMTKSDTWYKTRLERSAADPEKFDLKLGGTICLSRITKEEVLSVVKPITELFNEIERRRNDPT
jgi:hypothetical protein